MTVTEIKEKNNGMAQLEHEYIQGQSLWWDAWKRLIRNRAAMLGLVVIIIFILAAIFADQIAPQDYASQVLDDHDAAPMWVINAFSLPPKSTEYRIGRGWSAVVSTGDEVSSGDVLLEKADGSTRLASVSGTIFIDGSMLILVPFHVDRVEIPPGWELRVSDGESVTEGKILITETGGSGQVANSVNTQGGL